MKVLADRRRRLRMGAWTLLLIGAALIAWQYTASLSGPVYNFLFSAGATSLGVLSGSMLREAKNEHAN